METRRLLVVVALVVAGGALAFAGALPEGYRTVGAVVRDPDAFEGSAVELKATVAPGSLVRAGDGVRFLVADGPHALPVVWDPAVPLPEHEAGGTIEGKSVVVKGTVVRGEDGIYLLARDMQVGCASKYEPA